MYVTTMGVVNKKLTILKEDCFSDYKTGSVNVDRIVFNFSGEEWENLTKIAVFVTKDGTVKDVPLIGNYCDVPIDLYLADDIDPTNINYSFDISVGVYGQLIDEEAGTITKILPTNLVHKKVSLGSYFPGEEPSGLPTAEEWQIYIDEVGRLATKAKEEADRAEEIKGEVEELAVELDEKVEEIERKLENGDFDGRGIVDIEKISTVGLVDTYQINYTDGTTSTYEVTNGSGGNSTLRNDLLVSNPIGRYENGDVIAQGTEFETIFRGILTKVYYPTLTDPRTLLSVSVPQIVKVGQTVGRNRAQVVLNRGSISPQYTAESPYRSGEAEKYTIQITNSSIGSTWFDENNTGIFTLPAFSRSTPGVVSITGTSIYMQGCQPKDSDGNNYMSPLPKGQRTTVTTVRFILPFYYGSIDTVDPLPSGFPIMLLEDLSEKGEKTYTFSPNNQHMCILYDKNYGNIKSILDANNLELINGWSYKDVTVQGNAYRLFYSNQKVLGSNIKLTFKF